MQRLRTQEDRAQLTDDLDVITISQLDDYIIVNRKESALGSDNRSAFVVEGDNVADFGAWLSNIEADQGTEEQSAPESTFVQNNGVYERTAGVIMPQVVRPEIDIENLFCDVDTESDLGETFEELVESTQQLVEQARSALDILRGGAEYWTNTKLDQTATESGLIIPEGYTTALLATHTKSGLQETLVVDTARYGRIPVERAREFGAWIIAGRSELQKKKSVWG